MSYARDLEGPQPQNVAALLGDILLGSSSIDTAVQLYLDGIARAEGRAPTAATSQERLGQLLTFADELPDKALRDDIVRWMVRLHQVAPICRAVRHARWLPDMRRGDILMLAPLGEAPGPRRWETAQLQAVSSELVGLYRDLLRLFAAERGITLTRMVAFLSTQPLRDVAEVA